MPAKKKKKEEKVSFEQSLEELEDIVRRLDGEELGVEEAMAEYEKGLKALKRCRRTLDEAEKKLEMLVKEEDGEATTKPLPEEGEEPPEKPPAKKKAGKKAKKKKEEGFLF
jgi:exodeoxyribonuclease VII small subunit